MYFLAYLRVWCTTFGKILKFFLADTPVFCLAGCQNTPRAQWCSVSKPSKVPRLSFIARWWRKEVTRSFQSVFFQSRFRAVAKGEHLKRSLHLGDSLGKLTGLHPIILLKKLPCSSSTKYFSHFFVFFINRRNHVRKSGWSSTSIYIYVNMRIRQCKNLVQF